MYSPPLTAIITRPHSKPTSLFPLQNRKTPKLNHPFSSYHVSPNTTTNVSFSFLPESRLLRSVPSRSRPRVSSNDDQPLSPGLREFVTSERIKVVAMLALALALCNADRVVMSVAIVPLSLANGWTRSFSGIVQSSFLWGYLISPIAGGTLVDYYGGKVVMGWGVALWSLATFLTPWAAETSLFALLAMRALLGIAEGVALPCMNNMVARWFPKTERARAVGIAMAGFQLGSAIGLTLSPILMSKGGIFGPFVIFGLSGFLWVLVWLSAISGTPDRSPQISRYELEYIIDKRQMPVKSVPKTTVIVPPFSRLLAKMPTWSVIVANAMHSWGFFVILSWMPIYFNSIYHVDLKHAAWFSAVPWSVMAFMGYFGGLWSDMLINGGMSVTLTRKIMQVLFLFLYNQTSTSVDNIVIYVFTCQSHDAFPKDKDQIVPLVQSIGFLGPGIALIGLTTARSPSIASAWLTLAVGLKSFSHSGFLVNLQEIAPHYSGVLHGMSNTAGTLAAIMGTVGAGFFVELFGSFRGFLLLTAILYFLAAFFYNIFSTGEKMDIGDSG
ncbi:putative anion transporter 4, chloroplastic [Turnera subulata]|uniref:Anion transporter 4, chloroplastic n=1 Tax=Turnera subulata TaxID=218843 RepID=A0A9Q0GGP7_9ROSI|nr:putative anion transporter 4, chloroplastic [Turnera subulata]